MMELIGRKYELQLLLEQSSLEKHSDNRIYEREKVIERGMEYLG